MPSPAVMFLLGVAGLLTGCATLPGDALAPSETLLSDRSMQCRKYASTNESQILLASSSVLQDLGFLVEESDLELGLIAGSKMRSAHDIRQKAAAVVLGLVLGTYVPTDKEQLFRTCVTTHPAGDRHIVVRVTFQRIVWNAADDITTREPLKDPGIYQEFFTRLSKSIFLDAQEI